MKVGNPPSFGKTIRIVHSNCKNYIGEYVDDGFVYPVQHCCLHGKFRANCKDFKERIE